MNRTLFTVSLIAGLALSGCNKSEPAATETPAPAAEATAEAKGAPGGEAAGAAAQAEDAKGPASYGAPLGTSPQVELAQVLTVPDSYTDKSVTTKGYVRKACTKKGCWMEVATSDADDAPAARVTFKDYGFFVPLDSAGSQATLEGQVEIKTVDEGEVEHMEAEGAKFAAKSEDGSAREIRFVASGVELVR